MLVTHQWSNVWLNNINFQSKRNLVEIRSQKPSRLWFYVIDGLMSYLVEFAKELKHFNFPFDSNQLFFYRAD